MRRAASLALRALSSSAVTQAATQAHCCAPALVASASMPALARRSFATNSTDIYNVHKDTPDNNASTPFEVTAENMKKLDKIIGRYPPNYKASAVIPVLDLVQQMNFGYLSLNAMNKVAEILEMAPIRVYEVATFYSMFNRTKMGKYHVMVCGTTPCRLQGAQKIEAALVKHLGIHIGETTPDGMFTLGEMECMGACVNAPMIAIADYSKGIDGFSYLYYEDLAPADVVSIVSDLKAGKTPKVGSQYRSKAEPAGAMINGKWVPEKAGTVHTLTGTPTGPYCRNLDA
ncbi:hypothetical protein FOA52_012305 [Chlamydomonas sp. UWO 241]|nr:hypothetical protein FOA52_012305 [Chlamydomonas sp. UWO 241]